MRGATALAALLAALACLVGSAAAAPPRPIDLRVLGGDGWRSERFFDLEWVNPSTGGGPPLVAVHVRLHDPQGMPISTKRLNRAAISLGAVTVPPEPGSYGVAVWLEDASGAQGSAATATLRFDDQRPARVAAPRVPAWIGRTAFPLSLSLGPPLGPAPRSGIRGYAAAIGDDPAATPCTAEGRCSEAETTLRGGAAADTLTVAALPEGTSHLSVVAVSGAGMTSAATSRAMLRVDMADPVTRLTGVPAGWVNRPVPLTATASDSGSGMERGGEGPPPLTAIAIDGGAPTTATGPSVSATVVAGGVHEVAYYARDAAGNVNDGGASNNQLNRPPATATVRIDREPPSVAFVAAQDPADPELIVARVADALSGPSLSRAWIGVRRAGSGDRFEPLSTLPGGPGELHARWDSDAHPAGEYEFRAVAHDAAGNSAASTHRADGAAMVLRNPLKLPTALSATLSVTRSSSGAPFSSQRRTRRTGTNLVVPYGAAVRLRGRLNGGGAALAGQPVRVVERFAAGGAPRASTAVTGRGGEFSLALAPGPSREVTASFAGSPTLGRAGDQTLRLGVRSRVRLAASAARAEVGGAPVIFRGRVVAPRGAIPASGKSVQLQFRLPGLAWSEFRTVQTDRRGRFRYAYRFSDDDSRGVRFLFRAYAPTQDNWPYEPAGSRPVAVRGS